MNIETIRFFFLVYSLTHMLRPLALSVPRILLRLRSRENVIHDNAVVKRCWEGQRNDDSKKFIPNIKTN